MDKDKFRGGWLQFKGELTTSWNQVTEDDLAPVQGDYDKFCEVVQKRCGDCQDQVMQWTNDWYSKREQEEILARHATTSRNQM